MELVAWTHSFPFRGLFHKQGLGLPGLIKRTVMALCWFCFPFPPPHHRSLGRRVSLRGRLFPCPPLPVPGAAAPSVDAGCCLIFSCVGAGEFHWGNFMSSWLSLPWMKLSVGWALQRIPPTLHQPLGPCSPGSLCCSQTCPADQVRPLSGQGERGCSGGDSTQREPSARLPCPVRPVPKVLRSAVEP